MLKNGKLGIHVFQNFSLKELFKIMQSHMNWKDKFDSYYWISEDFSLMSEYNAWTRRSESLFECRCPVYLNPIKTVFFHSSWWLYSGAFKVTYHFYPQQTSFGLHPKRAKDLISFIGTLKPVIIIKIFHICICCIQPSFQVFSAVCQRWLKKNIKKLLKDRTS